VFDRIEPMLLSLKNDSLQQSSIIVYTSAKALEPDAPWRKLVEHLTKQQLIRLVYCFDEAREIPLQGEEFRKNTDGLERILFVLWNSTRRV
jgi:hypothetical protein